MKLLVSFVGSVSPQVSLGYFDEELNYMDQGFTGVTEAGFAGVDIGPKAIYAVDIRNLYTLDFDLNRLHRSQPLGMDLHGIAYKPSEYGYTDHVFIADTSTAKVIIYELETGVKSLFSFEHPDYDGSKEMAEKLHVNDIDFARSDGETPMMSMCVHGTYPDKGHTLGYTEGGFGQRVYLAQGLNQPHSFKFVPGGYIVCSSASCEVISNRSGFPKWTKQLGAYTRGLDISYERGEVYVGESERGNYIRLTILDLETGAIKTSRTISIKDSIFGPEIYAIKYMRE